MYYYLFLENSIHVNLENRARIAFLYRKKIFYVQKNFSYNKKTAYFPYKNKLFLYIQCIICIFY